MRRYLVVVIVALACAAQAQQQEAWNEDNSMQITLSAWLDPHGAPIAPEAIDLSMDTISGVAANLWTAHFVAADFATGVLTIVVPYADFHVVDRKQGHASQNVRLTYRWQWHGPQGDLRQGKDWTDFSIVRNDVLH
jgi:hypothetical protein